MPTSAFSGKIETLKANLRAVITGLIIEITAGP
jgi:hypothetical protein